MQQVMVCGGAAYLLDCFEDASSAYLVQELCKGGDLRRHVEVSHGALDRGQGSPEQGRKEERWRQERGQGKQVGQGVFGNATSQLLGGCVLLLSHHGAGANTSCPSAMALRFGQVCFYNICHVTSSTRFDSIHPATHALCRREGRWMRQH